MKRMGILKIDLSIDTNLIYERGSIVDQWRKGEISDKKVLGKLDTHLQNRFQEDSRPKYKKTF